ncbi:MAG: asparaginase [Alphaproteobacteria bacterium]|nr:asparaginase [Alphaproteobacteria bacterium]
MTENPFLVDVSRGDIVESRHRGRYVVADADGGIVAQGGDIEAAVFPRSAIKFLQGLPLVESGAADKLALGPAELAIACASHGGEPRHVETVRAWLARAGLSEADLECGAHMPSTASAAEALIRAGAQPTALHNNCSGKHTGMVSTCRHLGDPVRGYIAPEHPQQKRIVAVFEAMLDLDLGRAPRGTDGCSLPQIAIPLRALALGIARFGAPDRQPAARAAACRRLAAAILAAPFMLAGTGRFCTRAIEACGGKAVIKTGAEGVYVAAIPAKGLGIALKIDDGAARAAEVAMGRLLLAHGGLDDAARNAIEAMIAPTIANAAGRIVGGIAPAPGW